MLEYRGRSTIHSYSLKTIQNNKIIPFIYIFSVIYVIEEIEKKSNDGILFCILLDF